MTRPEPAPLFESLARAPDDGVARWLATADGLRVRAAAWGHGAPSGTVFMFPGRTEYIEKYGLTASELLERGFGTVTIDWRGQGISARMHSRRDLGHVGRFSDYQHDVAALVQFARDEKMPQPYYLIAHSMGGCIGLRALHEGMDVKAAAFSAPMWGIQMTSALRPVAWALSGVSRHTGLSGRMAPGQEPHPYVLRVAFEINTLTRDREMWDWMGKQIDAHPDLSLGGPSLNWLYEALSEMRALWRMDSPDVPTLGIVGTDEQIVDVDRIRDRMERWPGGHLEVIDGGRHEVLMEGPEVRGRVLDQIAAHFSAHA